LAAARRAATLARTEQEVYVVTALLADLAHEAGNHKQELKQAQRLVALRPHNLVSLEVLQRAAQCNQLANLQRRATAALAAQTRMDGSLKPQVPS
jgi:hypothetical protein